MKVVIDTSALIAVVLGEEHRDRIIRQTEGADLIAPETLHWEVGNAFSAMFTRDRLGLDAAVEALRRYDEIPIQWVEVALDDALRVSDRHDLYAYDAYMLVAARRHQAPLLTLDGGLKEAARESDIDLLEV
ncbi:putative nucleic acid-binding protein [Salinibacter ruber]|uniref:type II toxin-antitoxin system VapC family toxin n=1 Tax=Salinibacter ruber TaxID=146919 RepID=UPI002168B8CC|nr:type II toxin-antitoxin system VapC family toxin [Salinibacter ruber]MCS3649956.1 putative nucleic acid-binding protein [Salinibacter ruber]MCS3653209.1 putative nucleic acid-binding protein [Salinibacter ruber]